MSSEDEKKLKQKIYIVIALCVIILIAFFYLIIRDNIKKPVNPIIDDSSVIVETPDSVIVTEEPIQTPEESIIPEDTITPDTSAIPEETDKPEETQEPEETTIPEDTDPKQEDPPKEETKVDVHTDSSLYRVVNKDNPLDRNYVPKDMKKANVAQIGTQMLRSEAVEPLEEMFKAAEKDNIHLFLISGYRSYALQYSLWETYKARYGEATARRIDSYPGTSEHQTGLSVDLGGADRNCELKACFYDTKTYKWLHENAYKYGYIERNPRGSETVTKVQESPWNFRYIGKEEAEKIYKSGKTLEEYYQLN